MEHLRYLKIVNYVGAAFSALGAVVLIFLGVSFGFAFGAGADSGAMGGMLAAIFFVIALVLAGAAALQVMLGNKVSEGRWRLGQTIIAVINVPNIPIGTILGLYALWVCWVNPPTKAEFDANAA